MPCPFIKCHPPFTNHTCHWDLTQSKSCSTVLVDSKSLSVIKRHLVCELDAAPFTIILFSPLLMPYIGAILGPLVGPLVGPPHGGPPLTPLLFPLIPLYTTFHVIVGCNNKVTKPGPPLTPLLLPLILLHTTFHVLLARNCGLRQ